MLWLLLFLVFALFLYLFFICPRTSMHERLRPLFHTQFAHRGYHCAALGIPENSMTAFKAAIQKGYAIELDIHLTLDKKLIVFHDDTLDRVCNVSGTIESKTYEELKELRLLDTNEHIPLFKDVLDYINGQVPLLIEFKIPTHSIEICERAYSLLKTYKGLFLVQSFNTMGIRWFKLHASEVLRGQLASNLLKSKSPQPAYFKLLVRFLFINCLGRPDFISYKLADLPSVNVTLLKYLFHTPIAVWTLRTEDALHLGCTCYDMQIFEKHHEIY